MIVGTNSKICGEIKVNLDTNSNMADEGQLIEQARRDPAVFALLYRRHYDAVFRYCVHRLFDRHLAEDVTSTVFFSAVKNFHKFKGGERQFRNWLYTITTAAVNNQLRQTVRRERFLNLFREQLGNQAAACKDPPDELSERMLILKRAMLALKPRYQTIITLRFFENLKLVEIAEVLGSSQGTVRSQMARALGKLRKKMDRASREPAGGKRYD